MIADDCIHVNSKTGQTGSNRYYEHKVSHLHYIHYITHLINMTYNKCIQQCEHKNHVQQKVQQKSCTASGATEKIILSFMLVGSLFQQDTEQS